MEIKIIQDDSKFTEADVKAERPEDETNFIEDNRIENVSNKRIDRARIDRSDR